VTAVRCPCSICGGAGYIHPAPPPHAWLRCASCDGVGTTWVTGAPLFDCATTLADRETGELVTLGNGDRCRILWHMPRRKKKVVPITTFVGMIDEFTDEEHHTPVPFPSCVGVLSVELSRAIGDSDAHGGEKTIDYNDPVHRQVAGRLM
jgi:hypothetical protein